MKKSYNWHEKRGGVLTLFFVLRWVDVIWFIGSILILLGKLFLLPQSAETLSAGLLAIGFLAAQIVIDVQIILGLSPRRRQRPQTWQFWVLYLLQFLTVLCYSIMGIAQYGSTGSAIFPGVVYPILWSSYFRRSQRCAMYFGIQAKTPEEQPFCTLYNWTSWFLSMPVLKHASPEPVFAMLTALFYAEDPTSQQRILGYLQQNPFLTLKDRSLRYTETRQGLEDLNERLRNRNKQQPEDCALQWLVEQNCCQKSGNLRQMVYEALWNMRQQQQTTDSGTSAQPQTAVPPVNPQPQEAPTIDPEPQKADPQPQAVDPAANQARQMRFCPNCGTPVREDAAFCSWCGQALKP